MENVETRGPLSHGTFVAAHCILQGLLQDSVVLADDGAIVPVFLNPIPGGIVNLRGLIAKTGEEDRHSVMGIDFEPVSNRNQCYLRCLLQRIAKHTRGNGRKCNAVDVIFSCQLQTVPIAISEQASVIICAGINRANGVNHIVSFQIVALRDFGFTGLATVKRAALLQQSGARSAVDCPIHAAATQQTVFGSVNDTFHLCLGNILGPEGNDVFSLGGQVNFENCTNVGLREKEKLAPRVNHNAFDIGVHQSLLHEMLQVFRDGRSPCTGQRFFVAGERHCHQLLILQLKRSQFEVHITVHCKAIANLHRRGVEGSHDFIGHLDRNRNFVAAVDGHSDRFQNSNCVLIIELFAIGTSIIHCFDLCVDLLKGHRFL